MNINDENNNKSLANFKNQLYTQLEDGQHNAIADIIKAIVRSNYNFDKVKKIAITNSMLPLALETMPHALVESTKTLIESIELKPPLPKYIANKVEDWLKIWGEEMYLLGIPLIIMLIVLFLLLTINLLSIVSGSDRFDDLDIILSKFKTSFIYVNLLITIIGTIIFYTVWQKEEKDTVERKRESAFFYFCFLSFLFLAFGYFFIIFNSLILLCVDIEVTDFNKIKDFISSILNKISSLSLLGSYYVLNFENSINKTNNISKINPYLLIGLLFTLITLSVTDQYYFTESNIDGYISIMVIMLFCSRLDSKFLNVPEIFLYGLYFYGLLQILPSSVIILSSCVYLYAAIAKILLIIIIVGIYKNGYLTKYFNQIFSI